MKRFSLPAVAMGGVRSGRVLPTESPEQRDGASSMTLRMYIRDVRGSPSMASLKRSRTARQLVNGKRAWT